MDGIALIVGIDRLLDMCRTVVNVTGDAVVAVVVAASEGELAMASADPHQREFDDLSISEVPGESNATSVPPKAL